MSLNESVMQRDNLMAQQETSGLIAFTALPTYEQVTEHDHGSCEVVFRVSQSQGSWVHMLPQLATFGSECLNINCLLGKATCTAYPMTKTQGIRWPDNCLRRALIPALPYVLVTKEAAEAADLIRLLIFKHLDGPLAAHKPRDFNLPS